MDIERICRTHISTGELTPSSDLIQGLNEGKVILSQVVRGLGGFLTAEDDSVRHRALEFLSNVVKTMAPEKINRPATQTLTNFFVSKLDEFDSLSVILETLTVLSKLSTFDDGSVEQVYRSMVETLNMKAYAQAIRHQVYVLIDSFLALRREALRNMGVDFLNSYTKLVDGEKDPRNLMLLFNMDKVILLEFDVAEHIDEFFDITFCYFPISFRPPPNDPYGITAEDLKISLRGCMSATPKFARMAIPLFIEKFATSTGPSMKDLMQTLSVCLPVYGADAVRERGSELWEGIKTEILYSSDTSIEASALNALEALMRAIYPSTEDVATGLAEDIVKQCLMILDEPDKAQAFPATKALGALIRASVSPGAFAISQSIPRLVQQFNRPKLPSHRTSLMASIASLIAAAHSVYSVPDNKRSYTEERSLSLYSDSLVDVFREGLQSEGLQLFAGNGAVSLIGIPALCEASQVEDLIQGINNAVLGQTSEDVRASLTNALITLSKLVPSMIEQQTLPAMFNSLPDDAPSLSATNERESYRKTLDSLSQICTLPSLFQAMIVRIMARLDHLAGSLQGSDLRECAVAYAWDLLHGLDRTIQRKIDDHDSDLGMYFNKIIPWLYGFCVSAAAPRIGDVKPLFQDRRLLVIAAKIVDALMWELSDVHQGRAFADAYAAFEQGEMGRVVREPAQAKGMTSSTFRSGAPSAEQDLVTLYDATIQGVKSNCPAPYPSAEGFLTSKLHWTIHTAQDEFQSRQGLDLILAFVNKREKELGDSLEMILETVWVTEVIDTTRSFETRRRGLQAYIHIIKALALLRSPIAYSGIERIIDILKLSNFDPLIVNTAAEDLSILAERRGKERTSGHLTVRLLHAQRLWNHVLPRLLEGDKDVKGRERLSYLVTFASLLPIASASMLISDLSTTLPWILRALQLPQPFQRRNAVSALISILEVPNSSTPIDQLVHENAKSMVEGLIRTIIVGSDVALETSTDVRCTALRCLALFPDAIRFDAVRPLKSEVLRSLGKALDDPMRAVRREAVECRAKWYRYGGA